MKNRFVGGCLVAVLLANILFATPPVRGVERAPFDLSVSEKARKKGLSKEEIDTKIRSIKKTIGLLNIAHLVVPGVIIAAGITVLFISGLWAGKIGKKILGQSQPGELIMVEEKIVILKPETPEKLGEFRKFIIKKFLSKAIIPLTLAATAFIGTPIATFLSAIGLSNVTMGAAFMMAGELEQMEKRAQITLTADQKRTLVQLKNMAKDPITRGLVKYFALKKILKEVVATAMKRNPLLISTVAPGQPKKAHKIIARYIKLKWMEENSKKASAELAKETTSHLQRAHKKAVAQLQKIEQKIAKLEGKHSYLAKSPELKEAVQEFRKKAGSILEGLKKPVLKKEKPKPVVVPL